MPPSDSATEHLRVIRSLMERATVYRAISGPAALAGGSLALLLGGVLLARDEALSNSTFIAAWMLVLVLVAGINFTLLYRGAKQRGEAFVSAGMKHALAALAPPLTAGFVISILLAAASHRQNLDVLTEQCAAAPIAAVWILCYGLALLACGAFAPRSMRILGLTFFLFGLGLMGPALHAAGAENYRLGAKAMLGCFGILHLAYGCCVIFSRRNAG